MSCSFILTYIYLYTYETGATFHKNFIKYRPIDDVLGVNVKDFFDSQSFNHCLNSLVLKSA